MLSECNIWYKSYIWDHLVLKNAIMKGGNCFLHYMGEKTLQPKFIIKWDTAGVPVLK